MGQSEVPNPEEIETMAADDNHSRRLALKKLTVITGVTAGASAVPGKWTQPLLDRILVPAHAQTSETTTQSPAPNTTTTTTPQPCIIAGVFCWFRPGQNDPFVPDVDVTITVTEGGDVTADVDDGNSNVSGNGTLVPGGDTFNISSEGKGEFTITGTVECNSNTISGKFTSLSRDIPEEDYTATKTACNV